MAAGRSSMEKALQVLRYLPRVSMQNIQNNPGVKKIHRKRGQQGGDTRGYGNKGAKAHLHFAPLGYDGSNSPFYKKVPREPYYEGHQYRRQYPPLSLFKLQYMIDKGFIDTSKPIDLTTICNTSLYYINPKDQHFGIHLTDEGIDLFHAKVNIEVQHAKEAVIAAIEKCGGTITTAYYDVASIQAARNTVKFFKQSLPIPKRLLPPEDVLEYYSDPKFRGYLADPDKIAEERLVLAQKYGYVLPDINQDPDVEMLKMRKDPRQVFYGLEPGWLVNLRDKVVLKSSEKWLNEYYSS